MDWQNDLRSVIDHCTNWHEWGGEYDALVEGIITKHEALAAAVAAFVAAYATVRDFEAINWSGEAIDLVEIGLLQEALAAITGDSRPTPPDPPPTPGSSPSEGTEFSDSLPTSSEQT